MSKNTRWSSDDFKKKGLIEVPGKGFVRGSSLVSPVKVEKIIPGNKKIRNATKSVVDGVKFDSNLERYMYGLLQGAGVTFEFQRKFVLQEGFKYGKETIRPITLTIDFFLPTRNTLIDTKGIQTHEGTIKHKMLKKHLFKTDPYYLPSFELPSNKKECDLLLNRILFEPKK